jgi:hypothetical protein
VNWELESQQQPKNRTPENFPARSAKDYIVQIKEKKTDGTRKSPETKSNKLARKEHRSKTLKPNNARGEEKK